jgi:histidinol-phosphate phosphatase family protein
MMLPLSRAPDRRRSAVFLDRDGTLIVDKGPLRVPEELELLAGVGAALRQLREAGFRLVVLTNQPFIARGQATEAEVAAVHRRLEQELAKEGARLDGIYLCPHEPPRSSSPGPREAESSCGCRKPATGLVDSACRDLGLEAAGSWMIGDQTRDIELARRAGLHSILVRTGTAGLDGRFQVSPDHLADDVVGAAGIILGTCRARP